MIRAGSLQPVVMADQHREETAMTWNMARGEDSADHPAKGYDTFYGGEAAEDMREGFNPALLAKARRLGELRDDCSSVRTCPHYPKCRRHP